MSRTDFKSLTIMTPLHGIDFAAMGQRRFSQIKFIEIKGPVAEAVMRNNPNIKGRSQNFDPALFPQSPNEILGVADLFEIRNPKSEIQLRN